MSSDALNTSTIIKKIIHYLRHIAQRQNIFKVISEFFFVVVFILVTYLFIYLGFYVAFNTVQVTSRRVVGRADETRTYSSLGLFILVTKY